MQRPWLGGQHGWGEESKGRRSRKHGPVAGPPQDLWKGRKMQVTVLKHWEFHSSAFILVEFALVSAGSSVWAGWTAPGWGASLIPNLLGLLPVSLVSASVPLGAELVRPQGRPLEGKEGWRRSLWTGLFLLKKVTRKSRTLAGACHGCDLWSSEALQLTLGALRNAAGQRGSGAPPWAAPGEGSWGSG